MTPEMIYSCIAMAAGVIGYAVRHYQARQASASSSPTPTPAPGGSATPAVPGRISFGHGELLSLLLTALNSSPPTSGMPSIPTSAVSQPIALPATPPDSNAIIAALLAQLATSQRPTPPGPSQTPIQA